MSRIKVDVSVVFGGNEADIEECLRTLLHSTPPDVELSVTTIANHGPSPLAKTLERRFPEVEVVRNPAPRGFAENHNRTLRSTDADYVLVLNDDLVFGPDSIAPALAFMERQENWNVGVLGPRLLNPDGSLQRSTYAFPTVPRALLSVTGLRQRIPFVPFLDRVAGWAGRGGGRSRFWPHDRTMDVDTFRGAYMLARGTAVREAGPMDEASRIGVEEVEWHRRMWGVGWRVVFHPGAEVVHKGSRTISADPGVRNEFLKGFLNYFWKHRSVLAYRSFAALAALGLTLRWVVLLLTRRSEAAEVAKVGARLASAALWRVAPRS